MKKLGLFSSIRTKFTLTFTTMLLGLLILMNTYFLIASRDMIFSSKKSSVMNQASLIAANLEGPHSVLTNDDVIKVMEKLNIGGLARIIITGPEGRVLYDAAKSGDDMPEEPEPGFILKYTASALAGYDIFHSVFKNGVFSSSVFIPVMTKGGVIGSIYVCEKDEEQGAILVGLQSTLKNVSIAVATLFISLLVVILWTVMRRITAILHAVQSVREGEYNYKIKMSGKDELALLGDEFNSLTSRLHEVEQIRRQFVANASHELKTPLASIRLLSDSILQNDGMPNDKMREFVSDIGNEAERLTKTTEKLMSLTKHDMSISDEKTMVDMREVIISTMRMLRPLATGGNLALDSNLESGCFVLASEETVHQIVFNLVENAIKYNKPGGSVAISLQKGIGGVTFTVEDTGIGVPEEDMPFIFDRFYRVDKARSREAGGSGLGLSIVLNAVRELNGAVTAARRDGGGMKFQVVFSEHSKQALINNEERK